MIRNCQHCGAWFSADEINKALKNKDMLITCRFCGLSSEVGSIRSSNVDSGFERLKLGEFYEAGVYFTLAKDEAKRYKKDKSGVSHEVSYEAFIGDALAQSHVQVIFAEEDTEHKQLPRIICHQCSEEYIADNESFIKARADIMREMHHDPQSLDEEIEKLDFYEKYVDGIKEAYERLKRERGEKAYSVFIAYEDDPDMFSHSGYETAVRIKNNLPDELVRDAFLPDMEDFGSAENLGDRIRYEAAILYALENSNCMIAVCDSDIDSRLVDHYTRFYHGNKKCNNKKGDNLAFVRYTGKVSITLPDRSVVQTNVYDISEQNSYNNFALTKNGFMAAGPRESKKALEELVKEEVIIDIRKDRPYVFIGKESREKFIFFGHYPQRHVTDLDVQVHFDSLKKPDFDAENGWTVLYKDKDDYAYTWYRDETVNGKKYRGIYFAYYRDVYSVQDSDINPTEQKTYKYMPQRVHCFEYTPLVWQISEISSDMAVLVSSMAIDSMEYNNMDMSNEWDASTLHRWLNDTFLNTAFDEKEKEYLRMYAGAPEGEKVYLLEQKSMFDKKYYEHQQHMDGSDYYRCIGGQGSGIYNDPAASCYWIKVGEDSLDEEQAMTVHPGSKVYVCEQYVDCTTVAVVPKIILKLD